MPATYDLEPAATAVKSLLPQVSDDQLGAPTPCADTSVADLLFHVLGLSTAFRDAARKKFGPATSTSPTDVATDLPQDWRPQIEERLDELVAAWRDPQGWDGMTQAGGVELPGAVAGQVALNELVIHGWDLARATGQSFTADDETLQGSHDLLIASQDPADREGMFGPVVEVPAEAPLLDRVVGLSGRDPGWSAAQG
ncbi:MAG: TIGR03086 family protein [Nocardioidaceae bacterium]|nr:TIGR03086 family protein [Nocardioidaceae bacterium]